MKRTMMAVAAGMGLWGGMAQAAVDTGALVADLQREGYGWIEVTRGPTQIEVEAVRGDVKIETVYDTATGTVLDHETGRASLREQGLSGVEIRESTQDFEDHDDALDDDDRDDDQDGDDHDDDRDGDDDGRDDDRDDDRDGGDDDGDDD